MKFFAWLVACTALVSSVGCTASEYDVAQMEAEQAATSSPPARTGCSRAEWQAINAALEAARQQVDNLERTALGLIEKGDCVRRASLI